ncbi:MAG: hypothetical protein BWY09_01134 [Candidatus Hydrogenedentes bacterium ADurb.Bin179]|nr:MAG: hypothetical protein BWY09_01134 [Candidatus Hydrogenedentes bacterium ADurb.Bin179]
MVRSREAPWGSCATTIKNPWSSWGTKAVGTPMNSVYTPHTIAPNRIMESAPSRTTHLTAVI